MKDLLKAAGFILPIDKWSRVRYHCSQEVGILE